MGTTCKCRVVFELGFVVILVAAVGSSGQQWA